MTPTIHSKALLDLIRNKRFIIQVNTLNNSPQMMLGHVQTILSDNQMNALVTLLNCFLTSVVTYDERIA